jgi:hypothetical protein
MMQENTTKTSQPLEVLVIFKKVMESALQISTTMGIKVTFFFFFFYFFCFFFFIFSLSPDFFPFFILQDVIASFGSVYMGDRFFDAFFLNPGHGNSWIKVRLNGRKGSSNRLGIGARMEFVFLENGVSYFFHLSGTPFSAPSAYFFH